MRDWLWLLKWGWSASGLFVLVFLFATWQPAGVGDDDAQSSVIGDSGPGVENPQGDTATAATFGAVDRQPAAQASPYKLEFAYGFLPVTLGGQPSPGQADFYFVQIGDVTGDGRNDLVAMGYVSDDPHGEVLHVYPQLSNGTLGAPDRYAVSLVIGLALADMNNDGIDDVVISNMQGISLALSDGRGKLQVVPFSSTTGDKKGLHLAASAFDLDMDGNVDVIAHLSVTHADSGDATQDRRSRFRVFYGDGRGGTSHNRDFAIFGEETHDYGHYDSETPTALVVEDVNRDRLPDIIMASRRFVFADQQNPPYISVYLNDGSGGFMEPMVMSAIIPKEDLGSTALVNLGVGDFDGDGRQDIAAAPSSNFSDVYVFMQEINGTFRRTPAYSRAAVPIVKPMIGVDLDTDGSEDLLVAHSNWGQVGYYLQKNGLLGEESSVLLSGFAGTSGGGEIGQNSLAVGDLSSDGCPDVAVAASYEGLQVFLGRNCARRHVTGGRLPALRL